MWGVRDHRSTHDYGDAILGGRAAIPQILALFEKYGIRATWATVGLLFARSKTEMMDHFPQELPIYEDASLSPYRTIADEIGDTEQTDPLHFGRSLIDRIADTTGQEVSTHTFSHYYCLEPGQTLDCFDADISAAKSIAALAGHALKSIVFPRNQMTNAHISVCEKHGIAVFRGNPAGFANDPRSQNQNTTLVRGVRILDSVLPVFGRPSVPQPDFADGSINVTASRFLRPWSKRMPRLSDLQRRHVIAEMRHAAKQGEQYHLWWHPHNMGRNTVQNLWQLEQILMEFQKLRDAFGMESANMLDIAKASPS